MYTTFFSTLDIIASTALSRSYATRDGATGPEDTLRVALPRRPPRIPGLQKVLVSLANSTRSHDAKLLVAILPELHQVNDDSYPFKNAHQKIKDVMRAEKVPVLELIDGLKHHGLKVGS